MKGTCLAATQRRIGGWEGTVGRVPIPVLNVILLLLVIGAPARAVDHAFVMGSRMAAQVSPAPKPAEAESDSVGRVPDATPSAPADTARVPLRPSARAGRTPSQDRLPFADNDIPMRYPRLGVGFGIGFYQSSLSGLEPAFTAIEDGFRAQGYEIPQPSSISIDPVQVWSLALCLNRRVQLACRAGVSGDNTNRFDVVGGLVSYRHPLAGSKTISLLGELGAGRYRVSFKKEYNAIVSPYENGYDVLEKISFTGGGPYLTAAGGVSIGTEGRFAWDMFVQYIGAREISKTEPVIGELSVKPDGVLVGTSLTLFR